MPASYYDIPARFVPIVTWPGAKTVNRTRGPFRAGWADTLKLLKREIAALAGKNIVVQLDTDASQIRQDGYPRASAVCGPGVILTFDSRFGPLSYPCDTYTTWDQNIRGIALALEALRAVDRYGVTRRGEQYRGWAQLGSGATVQPAMTPEQAARFMAGVQHAASPDDVSAILRNPETYRRWYVHVAKLSHPDTGGSTDAFQRLQEAKRVLDQHFNGAR